MLNVLELPTEVSERVFAYLGTADRKAAKLVCSQWNYQLSSFRFWTETRLALTPSILAKWGSDEALQTDGGHRCVEMRYLFGDWRRRADVLVRVLQANRFSLTELSVQECSHESLDIIFEALAALRQLTHLRVAFSFERAIRSWLPQVPSSSAGLASVTHLDVTLANESCVGLVKRLAMQLTHLTLNMHRKDLLLQCCNEIQLPALTSLTVMMNRSTKIDFIRTAELAPGFWRTLEQLESFRCADAILLYAPLALMLRHCRNLKRLAIEDCNISAQCFEEIANLRGLQDLRLNVYHNIGTTGRGPAVLNLPRLNHLHLSTENDIRLGEQLTELRSVVIENPMQSFCPKAVLSEVKRIARLEGRRFRKLLFKRVIFDRETISYLDSISVDGLYFESCRIDGSLLEHLAERTTDRIWKLVMDGCVLTFDCEKPYGVRTVAELRARCPYLQLAARGTR